MVKLGFSRESNWLFWLNRALWATALAALVYLAALTVWLGLVGLFFPYQLDYGEGLLLHFVKEWSLGRPIYKAVAGYPYIMANYPPLAIVLALAVTPLLGVTYAAGRLWTLLAIAAVAAALAMLVHRARSSEAMQGPRWLPPVTAALFFLAGPYVYHWAPLFRVDLMGLALTLGGLYATSRLADSGSRRWLWLAVGLFVAGLYAKQSFFFAPGAALLYLFFCVNRRLAFLLAGFMAALGGGLFLLINLLTRGGFWYGLVASNVNPFLWSEFWKQTIDFARTYGVLALLSGWYLFDKFLRDRRPGTPRQGRRRLDEKAQVQDFYLLAAVVSLGFSGKAGAWENYYFEALAALALCAGLALARLRQSERLGKGLYSVAVPLLVLAQAALMWHTPRAADRYLRLTRESNEQMAPVLAALPDPMVSEDMGLLVTAGKVVDYCSFQYSQLARAGRWDQSWELGQLRDRRLSAVILERGTRSDVDRYQRFTREFVSELDRNYRHARTVGKYELYTPDPLQRERRAEFGDQLDLAGWSVHLPRPRAEDPQEAADLQVRPGEAITLTAVWQAQRKLETDYTAFAHLVDGSGRGWGGDDHAPFDGLYPTSAWGAGEMVRDAFTMTVPTDAPPGLYHIEVGWYDPRTEERLPVASSDAQPDNPEASAYPVAVVPVDWSQDMAQDIIPLNARFGQAIDAVPEPAIELHGYRLQATPQALRLTLRWLAKAYVDADYTVFVHLVPLEGDDKALSQGDAPPLSGRWPTSLWVPGQVLDDEHVVPLPADLPPGAYSLLVGLYDADTGQRLRLADGQDAVRLDLSLP